MIHIWPIWLQVIVRVILILWTIISSFPWESSWFGILFWLFFVYICIHVIVASITYNAIWRYISIFPTGEHWIKIKALLWSIISIGSAILMYFLLIAPEISNIFSNRFTRMIFWIYVIIFVEWIFLIYPAFAKTKVKPIE